MKLPHKLVALSLLVAAASISSAHVHTRHLATQHHHGSAGASAVTSQALTALQRDLETAVSSMTQALPIYDGNRVKSIHSAHAALVMVDRAIYGANAQKRTKPHVNDKVGSKGAHSKYTAQQISASQQAMVTGLAALTQAESDLKVAAGASPNKAAYAVNKHLQTAISEANKAISLHANGTSSSSGQAGAHA